MPYASTTTLNRIRDADLCVEGWGKLLRGLGKTKADDKPVRLLTILEINGFHYALRVLSYAMPDDRLARHFQARCAEQVLPIFEDMYPDDTRVRDQIAMLRNDDANAAERTAARAAARAAARDAARTNDRAAAWIAALAAVRDPVWDAAGIARDAAWEAGKDASWATQEKQLRLMLSE